MSHVVSIQTQVRDAAAVRAACQRLSLPSPNERTVTFFNDEATGLAIELPGWRYPVVCVPAAELRYDNFGGRWGDPAHLDAFLQAYAVERAKLEARRRGCSVTEQPLADGSIMLTVHVGGGS